MKTLHLLILVTIIIIVLLIVWHYHGTRNGVVNAVLKTKPKQKLLPAKPLSHFLSRADTRGAELFPDLLTSAECAEIIELYQSKFGERIRKHNDATDKNQWQTMVHNDELISMVKDRITKRALLSKDSRIRRDAALWTPYSRVRVVHYTDGQEKTLHKDTRYEENGMKCAYTCLVYLNEGYEGGRTISYPDFTEQYRDKNKAPRPGTLERQQILDSHNPQIVVPKTGLSALYDIDLMHRGEAVRGEKWLLIFKFMLPK